MFEAIARRIVGEPEAATEDSAKAPVITDGIDGRPRIGLALGGGAARGWAHIGVLRALHEAGIRPDVVTGTSIGAVVGGCYLAGHLDGLEEWARAVTRRKIFSLLDINFGGSGLISGSRLVRLLEDSLRNVTIEDLPASFVCVATELGSGHEVWLRSGPLALAMRASFALPGIFEPVAIGERWLVDGALVNPVPVSACRAFDARFVIAVNVHNATSARGTTVVDPAPLAAAPAGRVPAGDPDRNSARTLWRAQLVGHGDRPGIPTVMIESFNIIQDRISRSRLAGDPPDILVTPRVGNVGFLDFHRAAEAIAIGYEAGRRITDDVHAALEALAA